MAKTVHIGATELVTFDGFEHVPTVLYYDSPDDYRVGHAALAAATPQKRANANFKLELGRTDRHKDVLLRQTFNIANGGQRSAVQFANHFITNVIDRASEWVGRTRLEPATIVMVAEPLQFYLDQEQVNHDWLTNYRHHIRQILEKRFSLIEFLPEPFAVFLYYRYGIRHHFVTKSKKYIALVLDFGGGTFDASVIETSKDGDLVKTGARHAKPYAASSEPVGGFYINRVIAEQLLIKASTTSENRKKLRTAFNSVDDWRTRGLHDQLNAQNQAAMDWLEATMLAVEVPKIKLSRSIENWELDADLSQAVIVQLPENPLDPLSKIVDVELTAGEFRSIFVDRVWVQKLRAAVKRALDRAKSELKGKEINLLLLSGGSANIGWLSKLLSRDFESALETADQLTLTSDFQKIVATGLAVEGVRRNALEGGISEAIVTPPVSSFTSPKSAPRVLDAPPKSNHKDVVLTIEPAQEEDDVGRPLEALHEDGKAVETNFAGTTYNKVCLFLGPDHLPPSPLRFKTVGGAPNLEVEQPSVLLSSGTSLQDRIDQAMVWKVRLPKAPKHRLQFQFSRTDEWPIAVQDLYNTADHVFTGKNSPFGSHIWVELTIGEDGTCRPRFVYARDQAGNATSYRDGTPFALDMTSAVQRPTPVRTNKAVVSQSEQQMARPVVKEPMVKEQKPGAAWEQLTADHTVPGGFAFFGLDFGSTNTAVSYVSSRSIEICASRGAEWQQIEDLVDRLPHSVSGAAKAYCAPRDRRDRINAAYGFLEATLGFFAAVAYAEYARLDGRGKLMKNFIGSRRSLGPVKGLLDGALRVIGERSVILKALKKAILDNSAAIDIVVQQLNDYRHGKIPEDQVHEDEVCTLVANMCGTFTANRFLGYFETAAVSPFAEEVSGDFRVAHGSRLFLKKLDYRCVGAKPEQVPYLVDVESRTALPLAPLMLWRRHESQLGLWLLDGANTSSGFDFKESEGGGIFNLTASSDPHVLGRLAALSKEDIPVPAPTLIHVEKGWIDA